MKTPFIFRLGLVLFALSFAPRARAQTPAAAPALPGYWNLETNPSARHYTTVRFYTGQHQLVYEETLANFCVDFTRHRGQGRRIARQLDANLQLVLREPAATSRLLAGQFGQSRRTARAYATR